ncbi:MAG: hypothetical protein DMG22_11990 [Acidobacteria bacterium]|nr:MAG: hypothetical protein DMG22_11990 [Acidobacteriota bacterium]
MSPKSCRRRSSGERRSIISSTSKSRASPNAASGDPEDGDALRTSDPAAGLCSACRHARIVRSDRGSRFYLCERSRTDPRFAMYPRLPVTSCSGFEPRNENAATLRNDST